MPCESRLGATAAGGVTGRYSAWGGTEDWRRQGRRLYSNLKVGFCGDIDRPTNSDHGDVGLLVEGLGPRWHSSDEMPPPLFVCFGK